VTAFGDLEGRPPVLRSGAHVGDIVAVAGEVGAAASGLALLFQRAVDADGTPNALLAQGLRDEQPAAIDAQLRPTPPIAAGRAAAIAGARAMLDLSDGLALDARRIAEASDVGIDLDSASLGAHPRAALVGGEDHGLLACFAPDVVLPDTFRRVGTVVADSGLFVDGLPFTERGGWDPYAGWDGGLS
jgi:thiamine-monophosphate kinase